MLDVILIRPHRPLDPSKSPLTLGDRRQPLGLGFLQAYLQKHGFRVEILDNDIQRPPVGSIEWTVEYIKAKRPRFVGVYVHSAGVPEALALMQAIRKEVDVKFMVGGPHYTLFPDDAPEWIDHVVVGEGELAMLDIVQGRKCPRIHSRELIANLDELPWPSYDYFINQEYDFSISMFDMKPCVVSVNSSRGCPYACTFCGVQSVWGRRYRVFSAEYVYKYIRSLRRKYNVRGVYFREDNFLCSIKRVEKFCDLLLRDNFRLEWACEARVDTLDNNVGLLESIAASGCRGLYIGVESGSQRVLDLMNKQITLEQIIRVFDACKKVGIKTYASMCYGIPGETAKDRIETRKFLERIKPDAVSEAVFIGIPKSPLYDWLLKNEEYYYKDERRFLYPNGYRELCEEIYGGKDYRFIP